MKIRKRIEFYLAKIAGRDVDMDKITPNKASSTVEELLDEIAERIDDIEEGGGGAEDDAVELIITLNSTMTGCTATIDGEEVLYDAIKEKAAGKNLKCKINAEFQAEEGTQILEVGNLSVIDDIDLNLSVVMIAPMYPAIIAFHAIIMKEGTLLNTYNIALASD